MSKAGQISYLVPDGLGSVVATSDPTGTVTHSVVFDAWGNAKSEVGTRTHPFTYTGREVGEAGMLFYRARYYLPSIGKLTQEDPIRRSLWSGYSYVLNRPSTDIDPSGWVCNVRAWRDPARGGHRWVEWPGGGAGLYPKNANEIPRALIVPVDGAVQIPDSYQQFTGGNTTVDPHVGMESAPTFWTSKSDCPQLVSCLQRKAEEYRKNPPKYHIPGYNCRDFSHTLLSDCGVDYSELGFVEGAMGETIPIPNRPQSQQGRGPR